MINRFKSSINFNFSKRVAGSGMLLFAKISGYFTAMGVLAKVLSDRALAVAESSIYFLPLFAACFLFLVIIPYFNKKGLFVVYSSIFLLLASVFAFVGTKKELNKDTELTPRQYVAIIDVNSNYNIELFKLVIKGQKGSPFAKKSDFLKAFKLLLKKANANKVNKKLRGQTLIALAIKYKRVELVKLLLADKRVKVFEKTIKQGIVPLNAPYVSKLFNITPLQYALKEGNNEVVELLVAHYYWYAYEFTAKQLISIAALGIKTKHLKQRKEDSSFLARTKGYFSQKYNQIFKK
jgi:hypothetical protein